jgi:hypothetical protein
MLGHRATQKDIAKAVTEIVVLIIWPSFLILGAFFHNTIANL